MFHGLIANHAFADGNKRTAVLCLTVFCGLNDRPMAVRNDEMVGLVVDAADRTPPVDDVIARVNNLLGQDFGLS